MSSPRQLRWTAGGLLVLLLWVYWPTLTGMANRWADDPKYSHAYLVPLFSAWLFWRGWRKSPVSENYVGSWWGLPLLLLAVVVHMAGAFFFLESPAECSFLPTLAGVALCLGGWPLLRVAAPAIAFLGFMLPLPHSVETVLGAPLQRLATEASTYLLQMFGLTAAAEGNVIILTETKLGIVEACSGLGMLVTFVALATAVALVLDRPLLDKMLIVASALPIAVIANVIRITATGVLTETVGGRIANMVYHDGAGYLMMSLALALIWVELKMLSHLFIETPVAGSAGRSLGTALAGIPVRPELGKSNLPRRKNEGLSV